MKQKTCAEILTEIGGKIDNSPILKAACIYSDSVKKPATIYGYGKVGLIEAFKSGAEWQAKQMAWVSVNDKMPEDGHTVDSKTVYAHTKDVIVLYKNGVIGKGRRIYVSGINKKGWQWSCLKGEDITHWMNHPD